TTLARRRTSHLRGCRRRRRTRCGSYARCGRCLRPTCGGSHVPRTLRWRPARAVAADRLALLRPRALGSRDRSPASRVGAERLGQPSHTEYRHLGSLVSALMTDKRASLADAIATHVQRDDTLHCVVGHTRWTAATREVVRQWWGRNPNFTLVMLSLS